jgi:DNA-binding NarL/FixJ family response regulator
MAVFLTALLTGIGEIRMPVTMILADDHPMTRAGLVYWFSQRDRFRLLGDAASGDDAWKMILERDPDVALLDIEMPGENGISVARKIKKASLRTAALMLTSYRAQQYVLASLQAGASGFILKTAPLEELERAILEVDCGRFYVDPKISGVSLSQKTEKLSLREREVLILSAQGMPGKDAALALNISERTIEAHLGSVYSKFGVRNKTEAIIMALKTGVISLDELRVGEEFDAT